MSFMAAYRAGNPGLFSAAAPTDTDVVTWAAAVVTNGGTVSVGRTSLVTTMVTAWKAAGTWSLLDDAWLLVAENAPQALTSLKQRRLATAVAAPTFTANAGYAFNGTTQYLDTGWIASSHAVAMTGSNMRIAVYERTNVLGTTYAAGTSDVGTRNLVIVPRSGSQLLGMGCNSTFTTFPGTISDSRGMWSASRTAAGVFEGFSRGVSLGTILPANAASLPTRSIYVSAVNNAGAAGSFRSATQGFLAVGASLSGAQELADYNAVQSFMTGTGANV